MTSRSDEVHHDEIIDNSTHSRSSNQGSVITYIFSNVLSHQGRALKPLPCCIYKACKQHSYKVSSDSDDGDEGSTFRTVRRYIADMKGKVLLEKLIRN